MWQGWVRGVHGGIADDIGLVSTSRLPCYVFCICLLTEIQISWVGRSTSQKLYLAYNSLYTSCTWTQACLVFVREDLLLGFKRLFILAPYLNACSRYILTLCTAEYSLGLRCTICVCKVVQNFNTFGSLFSTFWLYCVESKCCFEHFELHSHETFGGNILQNSRSL